MLCIWWWCLRFLYMLQFFWQVLLCFKTTKLAMRHLFVFIFNFIQTSPILFVPSGSRRTIWGITRSNQIKFQILGKVNDLSDFDPLLKNWTLQIGQIINLFESLRKDEQFGVNYRSIWATWFFGPLFSGHLGF